MSDVVPAKPPTKTQILAAVAETTGLSQQQVAAVLDAITAEIAGSLNDEGPGAFVLPGLLKIERKDVPAKPARTGVPNPFKPGELMDIAAKPASKKVTVRPLKNLKAMADDEE